MRSLSRSTLTGVALLLGAGASLSPQDAEAQDRSGRSVTLRDQYSGEEQSFADAAAAKRLESISFLKDLLAKGTAEGDQKAEMMLRLADLYFQQGRYLYLSEMAAFDKVYEQCFNTEGCNTESLTADNAESTNWQEKSIKLYQQILRSYPRYARADEATFYLGSALKDVGRTPEAVDNFTSLVKKYPDSGFVPDAYVYIGEHYFDDNNAFKALLAFQRAAAYPQSDMYGYALYKLAWCQYNVGEYGKAIDTMKSVVAYSMAEGQNDNRKVQLEEEALRDLVRFFADAGELDEAYDYFNKLGKKELIRSMLKRLASMYYEQGKFDQAIQTYRRLISDNPQAEDNPDYQHEIVVAYKKTGKRNEALSEIERFRSTYGKNSAWARANASNQEAIGGAQDTIEKDLRSIAVDYHNDAKKYGKGAEATATYDLAYRAYSMYLEDYSDSSHAYDVHYAFGELLYKTGRFDEAYTQYMAVVTLDPKGQHSKFCAESAIHASDEMVKKEGGGNYAKPQAGQAKDPQPLTEWEQRLVDACKQFATLYPEEKNVKNVIYRSAYLLYNKYRFEEAAEQFNAVIAMDPASKEAEDAAHLILDSFTVTENWAALKKNSKFYYEQQGLGSSKFKTEMYDIYERASFKLIEIELAADEDKAKAADAFVAFYDEFPDSEVGAQALNNASVYYHEVGRPADALEIRLILVEDPKFGSKTKYYYDQVAALGFDYETIASFTNAASYYERLFSLYPKRRTELEKDSPDSVALLDENAADAIYSAALFRTAMGDWQTGIDNYNKFVTAFPADDRVNDVKLRIGRIYEDEGKWAEAGNAFFDFYKSAAPDTSAEFTYFARLHYAKALEQQGQESKANEVYTETVALYQTYIAKGGEPGAHTEFVAEMMYKLAEPTFAAYEASRIVGCGCTSREREDKALETSLKDKAKGLQGIEQTYVKIIDTGAGEWGLAAIIKLGQAYENMGDTLDGSAQPFYLTDEQREMYTMLIEDKVYPQIEKAVDAYKAALDKSFELTLYNENTAFATRRLGELRPNDFPGLEEDLIDARVTSATERTFDFESSL
jgi:tetratricopeptide (TPR) repeat protein